MVARAGEVPFSDLDGFSINNLVKITALGAVVTQFTLITTLQTLDSEWLSEPGLIVYPFRFFMQVTY